MPTLTYRMLAGSGMSGAGDEPRKRSMTFGGLAYVPFLLASATRSLTLTTLLMHHSSDSTPPRRRASRKVAPLDSDESPTQQSGLGDENAASTTPQIPETSPDFHQYRKTSKATMFRDGPYEQGLF
jgi:hypothetical protein